MATLKTDTTEEEFKYALEMLRLASVRQHQAAVKEWCQKLRTMFQEALNK
jgi:hypothetical protein